jgi:predicted permease
MFSDLAYRLRGLFRRRAVEADLDEELRAHLAHQVEKYVQAGLPLEAARRRAHLEFGGLDQVKEECRDARGVRFLETTLHDFRYGLRLLAKNPGFTAVAVITLALGIGANTAIFTLIDAVMLRAMPVRDPSQLVVLRWAAHQQPHRNGTSSFGDCDWRDDPKSPAGCSLPYPFFQQVRAEKDVFSGATAMAGPAPLVLSGNGLARMAKGEVVSGDYFATLGVKAALGRTLGPDDDAPSAAPAVVLSYGYWQNAFAGERAALGRTVLLNRVPFAIVGVAEPGFTRLTPGKTQDLFVPLAMLPRLNVSWASDKRELWGPNNWWLVVLARLKPGVSRGQAQAAATLTFRNEMLHGAKPASKEPDDPRIELLPADRGLAGERIGLYQPLYVLMGAVGFVLLIACANVAGLLLARAAARQKEMAVRLALGAGRGALLRQLLIESVTLSLAGGVVGTLLAVWGVRVMTSSYVLGAADSPFPFAVGPDWRAFAFTLSISLVTGVLFGLAPALRSTRLSLTLALKENASTLPGKAVHARRHWHLEKALVVVQVGLSMIVLVGAGLMVRTLANLHNLNPGFDTGNVLLFGLDPTLQKYKDGQIQSLYQNLQDQLAALPGVVSVSYSTNALLSGSLWTSDVHVDGQPQKTTEEVDMLAAGPEFLKTLHIPLLEGRALNRQDFDQAAQAAALGEAPQQTATPSGVLKAPGASTAVAPPIPVLVNAAFVHRYFAQQNPLGRMLSQGGSEGTSGNSAVGRPAAKRWEIVGVVGDTMYSDLRRAVHPAVIVPLTGGGAEFEVRTTLEPHTLIPTVRNLAMRLDSNVPISHLRTQTESIEELITQERVIARLASFFGVLALLLACIGLYGLLSYEVARRTREIGIRMSLGAERRDVTRLVLLRGLRLTAAGVGLGSAAGLVLMRVLSSLLYGVRPTDGITYLLIAALLTGVALLASYVPARRATRIDPMTALRYE